MSYIGEEYLSENPVSRSYNFKYQFCTRTRKIANQKTIQYLKCSDWTNFVIFSGEGDVCVFSHDCTCMTGILDKWYLCDIHIPILSIVAFMYFNEIEIFRSPWTFWVKQCIRIFTRYICIHSLFNLSLYIFYVRSLIKTYHHIRINSQTNKLSRLIA